MLVKSLKLRSQVKKLILTFLYKDELSGQNCELPCITIKCGGQVCKPIQGQFCITIDFSGQAYNEGLNGQVC